MAACAHRPVAGWHLLAKIWRPGIRARSPKVRSTWSRWQARPRPRRRRPQRTKKAAPQDSPYLVQLWLLVNDQAAISSAIPATLTPIWRQLRFFDRHARNRHRLRATALPPWPTCLPQIERWVQNLGLERLRWWPQGPAHRHFRPVPIVIPDLAGEAEDAKRLELVAMRGLMLRLGCDLISVRIRDPLGLW